MTYTEIFILGWNLNAFMFVVNLILAIKVISGNNPEELQEQNQVLTELKNEFEKFYPNRGIETLASYLIPFTAFFRVGWRLIEMMSFFNKNQGTKMFHFMVYKYQSDIDKAKRD